MSPLSANNAYRSGASGEEDDERLAHIDALREHLRVQTDILNRIADEVQRVRERRTAGGDALQPCAPLPFAPTPTCPNCRKTAGVAEQSQSDTAMRWFVCTRCPFVWRLPRQPSQS
jgi:DNA-directed RNA polymerase subunit M/transcription elongation factor TFIIS